ncbi:MAG: dihydroorotate dehydrogenase [Spirochaetales bacterium]|nr:dihydroorotate dehydrogenase [Spirochaetales bacterium]
MSLLEVKKGKLNLKNPILTASGTFGYGDEFEPFFDVSLLGGITIKGTTLNPKDGNPPPRIYEVYGGMLNSIGLANIGINQVIEKYSKYFLSLINSGCAVIININGEKIEDFLKIIEISDSTGCFNFYEINVSCPNVKKGGIAFSQDPKTMGKLINKIRKKTKTPIIVKLSPNVQSISPYVKSAEDSGADIISLINTMKGISIDINSKKPRFKNIYAGFSGPAIKPIALYHIYEARRSTCLPIIGMGGINNFNDMLEFFAVGADAIEVGTMNLVNPTITYELLIELEKYCENNKKPLSKIKEELTQWMKQ